MSVVPRFCYQPGTELTLFSRKLALNGLDESGYRFTDLHSGTITVVPFLKFVEYLKQPGTMIDAQAALTGSSLQTRLGGYASWKGLPEAQCDNAQFHHCLCQALGLLQDKIRTDTQNPRFRLSIRKMDKAENRGFVCRVASSLFGKPIHLTAPRGGRAEYWTLYGGRTLMKYFNT